MKKIRGKRALLAAALAAVLASGCGGRAGSAGFAPDESSVYIKKDGTIKSASVERSSNDYYTAEGLEEAAAQAVSAFNEEQAGRAQAKSGEGEEPLPVEISQCTVKEQGGEQVLTCILDYDSADTFLAFNSRIQNPEAAFAALSTDSVENMVARGDLVGSDFVDARGREVESGKVTSQGSLRAVKVQGAGLFETEGKVMYATQGCSLTEDGGVLTPQEGVSYIIFK